MSDRVAVMNEGRVLQVGTPSDIYEHPSTRFVADFIGDTNFLPAERVGNGNKGGQYRLRDTGAIIAADRDDAVADGAEVTLAVRPERAELLTDDREAAGTIIDGTLGTVVYFGTDTIFHLKLENGAAFRVRAQNHAAARIGLEPGTAVRVHIPRDADRVLAD